MTGIHDEVMTAVRAAGSQRKAAHALGISRGRLQRILRGRAGGSLRPSRRPHVPPADPGLVGRYVEVLIDTVGSQKALAARAGVTTSALGKIRRGQVMARPKTLCRLAAAAAKPGGG